MCVCVCVCASSHERLLRAGVHAWPREPTDPSKTLPASLPTEGMGLFLPLSWAGAGGQGEGVCVCVCVSACLWLSVWLLLCAFVWMSILGGGCACLCTHVIVSSSVYRLCGSAWCVITHLKFCALCLSWLCVVCVRAWFGGDKSHITRRGAGRMLPTQAGCAPWVQLTLPHHTPALSPTCLSLRGKVKARNKGYPHLL